MFCADCGSPIEEKGVSFCPACGSRVLSSPNAASSPAPPPSAEAPVVAAPLRIPSAPGPAPSKGFIGEAIREFGRKLERSKLRRQALQQAQQRSAALVRLGQRAFDERIDLVPFAELRDQLAASEQQAGELAKHTQQLEIERAALEASKNEATGKFDCRRTEVQQKKGLVDATLRVARQNVSAQEHTVQQTAARQSSVVAALAALDHELTALAASTAPDQAARISRAQAQQQQLLVERTRLATELEQGQAVLPAARAEVERLSAESAQYQAELGQIEADRQSVLSPIIAELQRRAGELNGLRQQANVVAGVRTQSLQKLGEALYSSRTAEPALAQEMGEIAATEIASLGTQAALEASLGRTRAVPSGTMLKFWSFVIIVPLLLVGLGYGAYAGWNRWRQPEWSRRAEHPGAGISISDISASKPCEDIEDPADCYLEKAWLIEELLGDLYTLEGSRDLRSVPAALDALATGEPDVQIVALNVLGPFADQPGVGAKALPWLLADDVRVQKGAAMVLRRTRDAGLIQLAAQFQQGHEGHNAAPAIAGWRDPAAHGLTAYPVAKRFPPGDSARTIGLMTDDAVDRVMQYYAQKAGLPPSAAKAYLDRLQERGSQLSKWADSPERERTKQEYQQLSQEYGRTHDPKILERMSSKNPFAPPDDGALTMPLPSGSAWLQTARYLVIEEQKGVPVRAVVAYREPVIDKTVVLLGWSPTVYPGPPDLRKVRLH